MRPDSSGEAGDLPKGQVVSSEEGTISPEVLVAVILTYGDGERESDLRLTLEAVVNSGVAKVVVVANGVSASYALALRGLENDFVPSGGLSIVWLAHNEGSAGGYRAGMRAALALASDSRFALLLDDDNQVTPSVLRDSIALVTQDPDGSTCCSLRGSVSIHRPVSPFLSFELRRRVRKPPVRRTISRPSEKWLPVDTAPYGGLILSRAALTSASSREAPDYVLYCDDRELTWHLSHHGFVIMGGPTGIDSSRQWFIGGSTHYFASLLASTSRVRKYYQVRNRVHFESHVVRSSRFEYAINRTVVMSYLRLIAVRDRQSASYRQIRKAVRDGEHGRLGMNPTYPLSDV
ncbi:glycosyltransferase [Rathayibacter sp. CAU 1779]